jgi:hypothetical protein
METPLNLVCCPFIMIIIYILYHYHRTFSSKGHWLRSCKMHWEDNKCVQKFWSGKKHCRLSSRFLYYFQLDTQSYKYYNIFLRLYVFRAPSAHLQEVLVINYTIM